MEEEFYQKDEENDYFQLSLIHLLGDRSEQQDDYYFSLNYSECLVTVCDGMGGYAGGQQASAAAVKCIGDRYDDAVLIPDPRQFLELATQAANQAVLQVKEGKPELAQAGTTMVSVLVQNRQLYWSSVGDSRAYLFRGGSFVQLTKDHNYQTVLEEQLRAGLIDRQQYGKESAKGAALISFLGRGSLQLIDYSQTPLPLSPEDRILIMSDGMYKLVEDEKMNSIIANFSNIHDALSMLKNRANRNARRLNVARDNITVALLKIRP